MKKHANVILPGFVVLLLAVMTVSSYAFDLIIPDTGQDLCYDWERILCDAWHMEGFDQVCDSEPYCPEQGEDFYGQDACYTINPPLLQDNADGTVTDLLTGLTWEQKNAESETYTYAYSDAESYCDALDLGGSTDWRMPTRAEFSTILNFGQVSPALDSAYFPYYSYTDGDDMTYWTSTQLYEDPGQVWKVLMSFGLMSYGPKTANPQLLHKVLCVSGDLLPQSVFTDNGNGTVTDHATGLMWEQKTDDGSSRDKDTTYTWLDALAFCENLVLAGHRDWRMPTPKELERIVDLTAVNPAADGTYFPNTASGRYWTGTTCSGCHKKVAFTIDFTDGELNKGNKVNNDATHDRLYVRAVRNVVPDVIELASLEATVVRKGVLIRWITASEIETAGFNLYRVDTATGGYHKLNESLLPATGSPLEGAEYECLDERAGKTTPYEYILEDVDRNGAATLHGPVRAVARRIRARSR